MVQAQAAHPEEIELLSQLRRKDHRARTTVVRNYHPALVRQAFLALRNASAAEDVVQDAWLAAFESIDGFKGSSGLYAWLVRIVLNKARNRRRRERRISAFSTRRSVGPRDRSSASGDEPELGEIASHEITPEWLLLEQEAIGRFDHALRALSEAQRSVVLLRDIHGASPAETCRALAINDLTHRVRLCRARASLRLAVEGDGTLERRLGD